MPREWYIAIMDNSPTPLVVAPKPSGRATLWLAVVAAFLGPALYMAQLNAGRLTVPWYLPGLGTVGFLLALSAFGRVRGFGRALLVGLLGLMACGEWFMIVKLSKLPPYSGPVAVGQPFPAFATTWADSSPFTQAN